MGFPKSAFIQNLTGPELEETIWLSYCLTAKLFRFFVIYFNCDYKYKKRGEFQKWQVYRWNVMWNVMLGVNSKHERLSQTQRWWFCMNLKKYIILLPGLFLWHCQDTAHMPHIWRTSSLHWLSHVMNDLHGLKIYFSHHYVEPPSAWHPLLPWAQRKSGNPTDLTLDVRGWASWAFYAPLRSLLAGSASRLLIFLHSLEK